MLVGGPGSRRVPEVFESKGSQFRGTVLRFRVLGYGLGFRV